MTSERKPVRPQPAVGSSSRPPSRSPLSQSPGSASSSTRVCRASPTSTPAAGRAASQRCASRRPPATSGPVVRRARLPARSGAAARRRTGRPSPRTPRPRSSPPTSPVRPWTWRSGGRRAVRASRCSLPCLRCRWRLPPAPCTAWGRSSPPLPRPGRHRWAAHWPLCPPTRGLRVGSCLPPRPSERGQPPSAQPS